MKKTALALLALAAVPLIARAERDSFARGEGGTGGRAASAPQLNEDPAGFVIWSGPELKGYGKKLAPKMNEKKLASERLAAFGNHLAMIAHRQADGEAELHETQADFFVVQSGAATLVVGGEVAGGKITAPGEVRGPSIKGGERKALGAGDIVRPRWPTSSSCRPARSSPTS